MNLKTNEKVSKFFPKKKTRLSDIKNDEQKLFNENFMKKKK